MTADRTPAPALTPDEAEVVPCHSRGPRIGSEGVPLCRLPLDHGGQHRPDLDDGWGSISWGDPR